MTSQERRTFDKHCQTSVRIYARAVMFLPRVDVPVQPVGPDGLGLFGIWFLELTGVCSVALKFSLPA